MGVGADPCVGPRGEWNGAKARMTVGEPPLRWHEVARWPRRWVVSIQRLPLHFSRHSTTVQGAERKQRRARRTRRARRERGSHETHEIREIGRRGRPVCRPVRAGNAGGAGAPHGLHGWVPQRVATAGREPGFLRALRQAQGPRGPRRSDRRLSDQFATRLPAGRANRFSRPAPRPVVHSERTRGARSRRSPLRCA